MTDEIERLQATIHRKDERIKAWKKSSDEYEAEIERLRKEADGLIELLRREKAEVERLQTAYRPADMLEYQKVVAEIERLRKVVEAAQDVVKCHSVAGIPHENQSMATVNAERQHTLLRLHAALAALEDDSD